MSDSSVYSTQLIERFENASNMKDPNIGSLDRNDKNTGTGIVGAPSCGDVMQFQIQVKDGVIIDAKFKTFGCGSAIASSSLATEWVKGRSIDEALKIKNVDIAEDLKLPPVKLHCSVLAEDAIKAAIEDYKEKQAS
jgi:Fe-S cluster assembly scaffold IscU